MRLTVRTERVASGASAEGARVLFASDLHLGWPWTAGVAPALVARARELRPDAIALGGDFVDHRRALPTLERLVRLLARIAPVGAISGNHDRTVDRSLGRDAVREHTARGGATWLEERPLRVGDVTLAWSHALPLARPHETVIAVAHAPSEVPAGCQWRAALAGHLHGGQAIAFTHRGRHWPGSFLSRWCGDRFELASGPLIVGRGAGDTLPLRWRCAKEVVLVECAGSGPRDGT